MYPGYDQWKRKWDFVCAFRRRFTSTLQVSRFLIEQACCPIWLRVRTSKERKLERSSVGRVLKVFGRSMFPGCPHRRRRFPLRNPTGDFYSKLSPIKRWDLNPVRKLGVAACLLLPTPFDTMGGAIRITLCDDRCSIMEFRFCAIH